MDVLGQMVRLCVCLEKQKHLCYYLPEFDVLFVFRFFWRRVRAMKFFCFSVSLFFLVRVVVLAVIAAVEFDGFRDDGGGDSWHNESQPFVDVGWPVSPEFGLYYLIWAATIIWSLSPMVLSPTRRKFVAVIAVGGVVGVVSTVYTRNLFTKLPPEGWTWVANVAFLELNTNGPVAALVLRCVVVVVFGHPVAARSLCLLTLDSIMALALRRFARGRWLARGHVVFFAGAIYNFVVTWQCLGCARFPCMCTYWLYVMLFGLVTAYVRYILSVVVDMDTTTVEWPAPTDWDRTLRLLAALHPRGVAAFIDADSGQVIVTVTDNSAQLTKEIPRRVGHRAVGFRLQRESPDQPHRQENARWDVAHETAERANAAVERDGLTVVAAVPDVSALVAAHPYDRGAVDYDRVVVVAFVDPTAPLPSPDHGLVCGEFPVEFEHARSRTHMRIRATPPTDVDEYESESKHRAQMDANPLCIGGDLHRRNDVYRTRGLFTLGCFARRQHDGALVAITAGHCVASHGTGVVAAEGTTFTQHRGRESVVVGRPGPARYYTRNRLEVYDYGMIELESSAIDACTLGTRLDWQHMTLDRGWDDEEAAVLVESVPSFTGRCLAEDDPVFHSVELTITHDPKAKEPQTVTENTTASPVLLFKLGCVSRLTVGTLRHAHVFVVAVPGQFVTRFTVRDVLPSWPFARGGDSGAVLFTEAGDAVAMYVGQTETKGMGNLTMVIPMHEVCRELKVELLGSQRPPDA
jgi:hypothetical protein